MFRRNAGLLALLFLFGSVFLAACGDATPASMPSGANVPTPHEVTAPPTVAMAHDTTTPAMMMHDTTAPAMMAHDTTAPAMMMHDTPTPPAMMAEPAMSNLPVLRNAPDFNNTTWINTPNNQPLNLAVLRGKVFAVEFWTFECINCQNVTPALKDLYATYADKGFTIVSFHDPEFDTEKDWNNVQAAVKDRGIKYPVAQDNDFATWNKYGVRAWPTLFLVDKQGRIRYEHIGEGAYDEIKANVAALLNEPTPAM